MTSTGPRPATRPHPAVRGPGAKSSDVVAWLSAIERDARRAAHALDEHAVTVYKGIRKSSRVPWGIDKIPAARRMRRHIQRIARAHEYAANSARAARADWIGTFGSPGSVRQVRASGIDFTK